MRTRLLTAILACAAFLPACGRTETAPTTPPAAILPAGLFIETEPADAVPVHTAKQSAREGERIVIRGRIGGTREPFVAGRAVMTIVDPGLPTCDERADDDCPTPWDYCCETRADIVASAATVQVSGDNGGPLRADLKNISGLKPGAEVVIVGTVGRTESPTAFLVHAKTIYVRK
jgi:predicted hotdog family 3-hydroxylacyl-ACP dehydratase